MRRLKRSLGWFVLLAIFIPITVSASVFYGQGWPQSWRTADWSATNTLPDPDVDTPAMIRVYAARSGRWKGIFATHHWMVTKRTGDIEYNRYDVVGWGTPVRKNNYAPDARWYSNDPMVVYELRGPEADKLIPKVEQAVASYRWQKRGSYFVWPGPNSNTFVAHILRQVPELKAEMDPTGVGKDYLGKGLQYVFL